MPLCSTSLFSVFDGGNYLGMLRDVIQDPDVRTICDESFNLCRGQDERVGNDPSPGRDMAMSKGNLVREADSQDCGLLRLRLWDTIQAPQQPGPARACPQLRTRTKRWGTAAFVMIEHGREDRERLRLFLRGLVDGDGEEKFRSEIPIRAFLLGVADDFSEGWLCLSDATWDGVL